MTECLCPFCKACQHIKLLSLKNKKSLLERMVKLQEEVGELAEAILITHPSSQGKYKKLPPHGLEKEIVDILLVTLDIYYSLHPNNDAELISLIHKKCKKWKKIQNKTA
ncbi:MAG: hypothetical protein EBZ47_03470 [Chlamydiae bacterium]|nr:hypothetical protein [Chlamydiota bacterium]